MISSHHAVLARHIPSRDENPTPTTPLRSAISDLARHRDGSKCFRPLRLRAVSARRIRSYAKQGVSPTSSPFQRSYLYTGTLPPLNSFVCHSYENTGGIPLFFPKWDRSSDAYAGSVFHPLPLCGLCDLCVETIRYPAPSPFPLHPSHRVRRLRPCRERTSVFPIFEFQVSSFESGPSTLDCRPLRSAQLSNILHYPLLTTHYPLSSRSSAILILRTRRLSFTLREPEGPRRRLDHFERIPSP